jgi:hypothetical protein
MTRAKKMTCRAGTNARRGDSIDAAIEAVEAVTASEQRALDAAESLQATVEDGLRRAGDVVGPEHCDEHRTHRVGCLACAAEVLVAHDDDLGGFLGRMESIGWPEVDA